MTGRRDGERHLLLIGLPGAGKTSVGRHLAKLLCRPFADADEQLELAAGSTIPRLVREHGEGELRRREDQTLTDLLRRDGALVVSAPGAVAISERNRALLAEAAVVIWLHASITLLTELGDPTHRPRLADDQRTALARLENELAVRYEDVADHVVDIEPFHSHDTVASTAEEPRHAISRHILDLLATGPHRDPALPPLDCPERELSALYEETADHIVDVEPFHALDDEPKRAISRHILDLLAADTPSTADP